MPIENVISAFSRGILSHNTVAAVPHRDVSMSEVQGRRSTIQVPNGLMLHDYANVYFNARNPMMYKLKDSCDALCVLKVSKQILDIDGVVITDGNAGSGWSAFKHPREMSSLDFNAIYAQSWVHANDEIATKIHKRSMCAEVLVPKSISPNYLNGIYVVNKSVETKMKQQGFTGEIAINPAMFFR
jgi:hypothetical protein